MPMQVLRYEGYLDYPGLLNMMYSWLILRDWDVDETKAVHAPKPLGADREIKWKCQINESDYVRFNVAISMIFHELRQEEVKVNGEKKQTYHSRFYIEIESEVETDWQEKFKGSKFKEKLGKWYDSFVYGEEIGGIWEDKLYYTTLKFYDEIKRYLNMESRGIS